MSSDEQPGQEAFRKIDRLLEATKSAWQPLAVHGPQSPGLYRHKVSKSTVLVTGWFSGRPIWGPQLTGASKRYARYRERDIDLQVMFAASRFSSEAQKLRTRVRRVLIDPSGVSSDPGDLSRDEQDLITAVLKILAPSASSHRPSLSALLESHGARSSPRVFLSYSQESDFHASRVLELAGSLRSAGIDARIDRYTPYPDDGWPRWMQQEMEASKHVILVCTPTYKERFEGRASEGRGVTWEGLLARTWFYEQGARNTTAKTFVPVWFEPAGREAVPRVLRELPGHDLSTPAGIQQLIRRLRGSPEVAMPALGTHDGMPDRPALNQAADALRVIRDQRLAHGKDAAEVEGELKTVEDELNTYVRLSPGSLLGGRFRLEQRIGQGSYGSVWRAVELQRSRVVRTVAVKVLHAQHLENNDRREVERFFRGARALARFDSQHVVRLHVPDGEEGGQVYYVMEYLDAGDLEDAVTGGRLTQAEALSAVCLAAAGIQEAHNQGIIHRDVKPKNILLSTKGDVKVADFDLARLPESVAGGTRVMGSFIYAAPELMEDARTSTHIADVYGLAMTAAFCALGRTPKEKVRYNAEAELGGLPPRLRAVIARGIALEPSERWSSADKFASELRRAFRA